MLCSIASMNTVVVVVCYSVLTGSSSTEFLTVAVMPSALATRVIQAATVCA
jgi:hypothetical protein